MQTDLSLHPIGEAVICSGPAGRVGGPKTEGSSIYLLLSVLSTHSLTHWLHACMHTFTNVAHDSSLVWSGLVGSNSARLSSVVAQQPASRAKAFAFKTRLVPSEVTERPPRTDMHDMTCDRKRKKGKEKEKSLVPRRVKPVFQVSRPGELGLGW